MESIVITHFSSYYEQSAFSKSKSFLSHGASDKVRYWRKEGTINQMFKQDPSFAVSSVELAKSNRKEAT